jgi:hypothetical protein
MVAAAKMLGAQLNPWLSDVEPYRFLLQRLLADVRE